MPASLIIIGTVTGLIKTNLRKTEQLLASVKYMITWITVEKASGWPDETFISHNNCKEVIVRVPLVALS